jgi:hypothetical protein
MKKPYEQDPKRRQGRPKTLKRLPRVYNIDRGDAPASARYCGRGTPHGNPFFIGGWWPAQRRRMTRDDVCNRFRDERLPNLDVSELRGLDLECHCAPLRCHCDDIIRKANPGYDQILQEAREARETKTEGKNKAISEGLKAFHGSSGKTDQERWKERNDRRSAERAAYRAKRGDEA